MKKTRLTSQLGLPSHLAPRAAKVVIFCHSLRSYIRGIKSFSITGLRIFLSHSRFCAYGAREIGQFGLSRIRTNAKRVLRQQAAIFEEKDAVLFHVSKGKNGESLYSVVLLANASETNPAHSSMPRWNRWRPLRTGQDPEQGSLRPVFTVPCLCDYRVCTAFTQYYNVI